MCVALTHVVLAAETLALVGLTKRETVEQISRRVPYVARASHVASAMRTDLAALKIKTHLN
jgi:hypothetical protein